VQVGDGEKDLSFRIATTNAAGNVITQIADGSVFQLRVFVKDLRADDGDGDNNDDRGVFAAYMDLLYDSGLVSTIPNSANPRGFSVTFGPDYNANGLSGESKNFVIDELGAFQASANPLGPNEKLLAVITLLAEAPGVARFFVDPADITPLHDSLLFEPTDPVSIDRIDLGLTEITITAPLAGGEGESPFQNPRNQYDVDDNGQVTPRDVLLIVNRLNSATGGEGEGGQASMVYYDVNGDGLGTPHDALKVVNFLNAQIVTIGGGEGEGGDQGGQPVEPTGAADHVASLFSGPSLVVSQPQYASRARTATPPAAAPGQVPSTNGLGQPEAVDHDALFADWSRDDQQQERLDLDLDAMLNQQYAADLAWSGGLKES